jgi:hypothetical protein
MTDELMQEIEAEYLYQCRRSFETQDCGIAANLLDRIKTELSDKDARIAELKAALKPLAFFGNMWPDHHDDELVRISIKNGDLRAARAAYLGEKE